MLVVGCFRIQVSMSVAGEQSSWLIKELGVREIYQGKGRTARHPKRTLKSGPGPTYRDGSTRYFSPVDLRSYAARMSGWSMSARLMVLV